MNFEDSNFKENKWVEMEMKGKMLHFKCKQDIVIDTKAVESILIDKNLFTNGLSVPAFVDFRGVKYFTITSMTLVSTQNYILNFRALAVLLGSFPQITLGNFFLHIYKQSVPVKMFTDEEKALKWLDKINA